MNNRRKGTKRLLVNLAVLLPLMMLLGGALLAFASSDLSPIVFSRYYETERLGVEYEVVRVTVVRERMHTVSFYRDESKAEGLVGSTWVRHLYNIPPFRSIKGLDALRLGPDEEFHGWYYIDSSGERVYVPDPSVVTVTSDMDLFADIRQNLPRGIAFVFYGYLGREATVSVNGKPEQRQIADLHQPTSVVYESYAYIIDGVNRVGITWMFVEEAYNRWQVRGYNKDERGYYTIRNGETHGVKPEFFGNYRLMWNVYDNSIDSNGRFVAERGYDDFKYYPNPQNPANLNTFYMDYAIANNMEFVKMTTEHHGDYLVATFHVYPIHLNENDYDLWISEGGVQGEDEE